MSSATKRISSELSIGSDGSSGSGTTEKRRGRVNPDDEVKLVVTSAEELDIGLLRIQNRKLYDRLRATKRLEADLRQRIDQLEKRQHTDQSTLYAINRYWNQLNEDLTLVLQRFEEDVQESSTTPNAEHGEIVEQSSEVTTSFVRQLANIAKEELDEQMQQRVKMSTKVVEKVLFTLDRLFQRTDQLYTAISQYTGAEGKENDSQPSPSTSLNETVRTLNTQLSSENRQLNTQLTSLHQQHNLINHKYTELQDSLEVKNLTIDELKSRLDDLERQLNRSRTRERRLEEHLYDVREKLRDLQAGGSAGSSASSGLANTSGGRTSQLQHDLEEQRELAQSRLAELETLNAEHKKTLSKLEHIKIDLTCLPDHIIQQSAEYKTLQAHFSVLFNESVELKNQVDELKEELAKTTAEHRKIIEKMEADEVAIQQKLRMDLLDLEGRFAAKRKECDKIQLELETTQTIHKQAIPLHREMRQLISSLQSHSKQLQSESGRLKKKLNEAQVEIERLKVTIEEHYKEGGGGGVKVLPGGVVLTEDAELKPKPTADVNVKNEPFDIDLELTVKPEELAKFEEEEAKALTSMTAMATTSSSSPNSNNTNMAQKLITKYREIMTHLERSIAECKQDEEVLLAEMEVTGQAYEDMQEQNGRLREQIREKESANLVLMTEQIKWKQLQKRHQEEKEALVEQVTVVMSQLEATNTLVAQYQEQEQLLKSSAATLEARAASHLKTAEYVKRKALEYAQSAADLQLQVNKYKGQIGELQSVVSEKTGAWQEECFKTKRLAEELAVIKRKYERAKQFELATSADEVLQEEIRELKAELTCPSCKTKRKDAVLVKCFHVFCYDCLKTRYETRQRKCPKCNQSFGLHDYHRLYLA